MGNDHDTSYDLGKNQEGRGTLILVFGILSILLMGPFLGIPAYIMGKKDLKKIKEGIIAFTEKTTTQTGMILGIIGTFISAFTFIVVGVGVVIGLNTFSKSVMEANRDALIADGIFIESSAQQYHSKPVSLGGGDSSFGGYEIPLNLNETPNGTFSIESMDAQSLIIIGTGIEPGNDGLHPVKIRIKVIPRKPFDIEVLN